MGRASGEDARPDHSPIRRLATRLELWSGLHPPGEETPTRKPAP